MPQPPPSPAPLDDDDFDRMHAERRRARRKALWWLFGGFALLFALFAWGFIADEPPPDTSDLRVAFKHPPEDQNAYALLTNLVATLPPEPNRNTPEERHFERIFSTDAVDQVAWNQAIVATVLGRYPADLAEQVRTALTAPACEALEIKSYNDIIPEVGGFRLLSARLTQLSALAWHTGDHATAAELNLLVLHLGQRISQSQGPLITVLTGTAIQRMAMDSICRHVDDPTITPDTLRRYLARIPPHEIQIGDYHTAYKMEFAVFANTAANINPAELSEMTADIKSPKAFGWLMALPGAYQPNRTIRWHAEFLRTQITNPAPLPPGAINPNSIRFADIVNAPWPERAQNFGGRKLLAVTSPIRGLTTSAHRIRANLRLTQIYVALRLYQLEHDNTLPADLPELVPAYLPAIPLDPFGGQPLRYDRALTTIWSIDQDHHTITDADGKLPERGMPAYRILFARPPVELPAYAEEPAE